MKNTTLCIFSVLGGMVLGSAVALALAPKTGQEMRGFVRDFLNDIAALFAEKYNIIFCLCHYKIPLLSQNCLHIDSGIPKLFAHDLYLYIFVVMKLHREA